MALGVYQNTVVSSDGTPAQGIAIIVTDSVTGDPAVIYADETGGTPLTALQTDTLGYFKFAAAGGFYNITFGTATDAPTWTRIAIGTFQAEDYDRVWRPGESSESLADAVTAIQTDSAITSTPATTGITGATNVELALTSLYANSLQPSQLTSGVDVTTVDGGITLSSNLTRYTLVTLPENIRQITNRTIIVPLNLSSLYIRPSSSLVKGDQFEIIVENGDTAEVTECIVGLGDWIITRDATADAASTTLTVDPTGLTVGDLVIAEELVEGTTIDAVGGSSITLDTATIGAIDGPVSFNVGPRGAIDGQSGDRTLAPGRHILTVEDASDGIRLSIDGEIIGVEPVPVSNNEVGVDETGTQVLAIRDDHVGAMCKVDSGVDLVRFPATLQPFGANSAAWGSLWIPTPGTEIEAASPNVIRWQGVTGSVVTTHAQATVFWIARQDDVIDLLSASLEAAL